MTLVENPKMLEGADIVNIQRLLTSIIRSDRHVMSTKGARGPLTILIEKGFLLKIFYRLEDILKEKRTQFT
ncbi:MAG: hypothetical protein HY223_04275 [Thaumarchaeota archaeon]|nr:hypothetical protein [Nitrososphaerota archaeon]